jgi:Asp-tRNA(Asn)/Glu-tRNA(Gln) amidotransferase A subunit family amidase
MKEWLKRPLTEMIAGLAAREISAEELMRATLQRIDETQ